MEAAIVFLLALLCVIVAGAAFYLGRQMRDVQTVSPGIDALRQELDARHDADVERFRGEVQVVLTTLDGELRRLRDGLRDTHDEHQLRVVALRERVADVDTQTAAAIE